MNPKLHIGTSGFHYKDWKEKFYPKGLKNTEWLPYLAQHFSTVELNSPFYRLPTKETIKSWVKNSPANFLFTIKASRMITHYLRLKYCDDALKNFFKIINPIKKAKKLACILYQLPPSFKKNIEVLENFFKILPKGYKHVFEFRHESWNDRETFNLLKKYKIIYCIISSGRMESHFISTAGTVYIRFHGPENAYSSEYSIKELKSWATKIKEFLQKKKEVFAYFNNDVNAYAVENAKQLIEILSRY